MAERTLRAGGVYHQTASLVQNLGDQHSEHIVEVWADATRDAVRVEWSTPDDQDRPSSVEQLTVDGVRYMAGTRLEPASCAGAGSATTAILVCGDAMSVETATHEGRPALVLVSSSETSGSDGTSKGTTRLIVDPDTGLPLAMSATGEYHAGSVLTTSAETVHSGEFLEPSAVPADLFDPASLGLATQPEAELPTDVPVHWLGRQFDPGHGLPSLVFALVERGSDNGSYVAILRYSTSATASAQPLLMIQLWRRVQFEQSMFVHAPCPDTPPLQVAVGAATFQCSTGEDNTGDVLVQTADTVLLISAPSTHADAGTLPNPYRNRDAMRLVVEGLQPRVP